MSILIGRFSYTLYVHRNTPLAEIIRPKTIPVVIKNDKAYNQTLAYALAGKTDLIVSGDRRHLIPLKEYKGIPIVAPVDFSRFYPDAWRVIEEALLRQRLVLIPYRILAGFSIVP